MVTPNNANDDTKSSNSNDKPENPFIKFRRFADTQVGSVLQRIIGLPSAFSTQSSEANARWTDFQDELKRRERAHADAEAPETRCGSDDEELKYLGSSSASTQPKPPNPSTNGTNGQHYYEVDLYTPITKTLFNHLGRASSDETDIDKASSTGFQFKIKNPWESFDDQKPTRSLRMIQSIVYNDIYGITPRTYLFSHLNSSIIPYVLFSPYSPLALSNMPTPSKGQGLYGCNTRDYPFIAAFEDLLLASQGRRMGFWTHVGDESSARLASHYDGMMCPNNATNSSTNLELANETRKVNVGLNWVRNLYKYGLLGPIPTDIERAVTQQPNYLQVAEQKQNENSVSSHSESEHEYLSEQDAFDQLQEMIHQESSALSADYIMRLMSSIDDGNVLWRRVFLGNEKNEIEKGQDTPTKNSVRAEFSDIRHLIHELFGEVPTSMTIPTQTESSHDSFPRTSNSKAAIMEHDTQEEESERGTERPVSTTRTTEQTKNESGTVETKVTIEKIFADGRRNVTITEHIEVPSERWRTVGEEDVEDWKDLKGETAEGRVEGNKDNDEDNDKGKKKTRGWFWN